MTTATHTRRSPIVFAAVGALIALAIAATVAFTAGGSAPCSTQAASDVAVAHVERMYPTFDHADDDFNVQVATRNEVDSTGYAVVAIVQGPAVTVSLKCYPDGWRAQGVS